MGDKNFIVYDNNGKPERRIKLDLTLQNIAFDLKTLCSRQSNCDEDRKEIRDTAEGAEKKIDNHVLISKDREGRGRFTFGRITTVAGLILAAVAIFVSWSFVNSVHGSEMETETLSCVEESLDNVKENF